MNEQNKEQGEPATGQRAGGSGVPANHGSGAITGHGAASPGSHWQKFKLIFKVVEVRLRFIAILVTIALFVGYWDAIQNRWEKQARPDGGVHRAVRAVFGEAAAHRLWPHGGHASVADPDTEYYCPMHPNVVRPVEANMAVPKCPICGMPLSLRQKGELSGLPDGVLSRKQLSPDQIQLAGIQTVEVLHRPLMKELTAVGYVGYDESGRSRIVTRVAGFLEKLYIDKPWITVNRGDPLAEIYSPELYSAARELLLATERGDNSQLARSGRERLRLLGINDQEIDELVVARRANHRLVIRSPRAGHVVRKDVLEGEHVEAGQNLFEIADLSTVWVEAEVYEADIGFLREGQAAEVTIEAFRDRVFTGKVSLVHPHLESSTRTNTVRFELANPGHQLRPGMFATVRISALLSEMEPFAGGATPGEVLAVPEQAVIDTGTKRIVYIEREPGRFDGVQVELGPRAGAFYPVVRGLEPGDRVAAAGSFLIDAETRLNPAAASTYLGASGRPADSKTGHSDHIATAPRKSKTLARDELVNINQLEPPDRKRAIDQRLCPVSDQPLGSMGMPRKVTVAGQDVFLCCQGCEAELLKEPDKFLNKIQSERGDVVP